MNAKDLAFQETMFCYSLKCGGTVRLVGVEIELADIAESRPEITSYSIPGPEIALDGVEPEEKFCLQMSVQWRDGVAGAFHFLAKHQIDSGIREKLNARAGEIGLRLETFDMDHLDSNEKHYAAWRQLVRFIHPMTKPERWPLCQRICSIDWPSERMTVADVARLSKTDACTALESVAVLLYQGELNFDSGRGTFNLTSHVWKKV